MANPSRPAGPWWRRVAHGGGTLLRFFNMGLETRCPLLQGSHMSLIAEDGHPYTYPKEHYVASLPAGKTLDALVAFPAAGTYPLYDRRMGLTNAQTTGGGMLTRLAIAAGNFWPVITVGHGHPGDDHRQPDEPARGQRHRLRRPRALKL